MKTMAAMVLVAFIVVMAIINGINGVLLATGMSLIAGLAGYQIAKRLK